jgi:uncharacterized protein YjiS (DUF1127 family)
MTAISVAGTSLNDGRSGSGMTIVAWLISRIKRRHTRSSRRSGNLRLSDAMLSDLGITREQAEFGRE